MVGNESSMGRLHALWTLEGLGKLKSEQIAAALQDNEAGIRENAIKLAELHLSDFPELKNALVDLQSDPDARVRFQLLCTLGSIHSKQQIKHRQQLLFQDIDDKWMQVAALSASSKPTALLNVVMEKFREDKPSHARLLEQIAAMMASADQENSIQEVMRYAAKAEKQNQLTMQAALLEGLAKGLQNKKTVNLFCIRSITSDQNIF